MTSLRGRCHTFDVRADGYCRGEGSGSYCLLADTSTRHASPVVAPVDSAVQQDGPSASLTAPNGSSQRRLLEAVRDVSSEGTLSTVLEAHGTGTALGDPIEVCGRSDFSWLT